TSLDMEKLESYVDTNYARDSQGYGGGISEPPPTIVIMNPTASDTLEYNGVALSSPQLTSSSPGGSVTLPGTPSFGYTNDYAAGSGLPSFQPQVLGTATADLL